jgi:Pvc16 N-terminal domain/Carboxypeptidase regulatory-like domain
MINDLSLTLRAILDDPGLTATFPELAAAQIVFDRPAETFSPTQTTVDLFLYDIRENLELRDNEPTIERRNGQVITRRPPLRVACSYLVTAWPVGGGELPLQEHLLLSQVLQVLSSYPTIPTRFLQGSLVGQEPPLPMVVLHPDALKNISEFWTSLGNKLRPSLTLTATIGMNTLAPETAPMVITWETSLQKVNLPATQETSFGIGGQVIDNANVPVVGATVTLVERDVTTTTDAAGYFTLSALTSGSYTLRVQSGATTRNVNITVPAVTGTNYNVQLA